MMPRALAMVAAVAGRLVEDCAGNASGGSDGGMTATLLGVMLRALMGSYGKKNIFQQHRHRA